jgi:undecaprenyl-diphosphatase
MLDQIATRDHRLMRRLNNWPAPYWVRVWMLAATRAGDGWLWYLLGLGVLLWGGARRFPAIGAASTAAAVGFLLFTVVKRRTGRRRPCDIQPHCWARLLPPDRFSFPSGHSISAFAAAVAFGLFYPVLLPALLFCALSIAVSRIVLGMHFLSDVAAGSGLGILLGYSSYLVYR